VHQFCPTIDQAASNDMQRRQLFLTMTMNQIVLVTRTIMVLGKKRVCTLQRFFSAQRVNLRVPIISKLTSFPKSTTLRGKRGILATAMATAIATVTPRTIRTATIVKPHALPSGADHLFLTAVIPWVIWSRHPTRGQGIRNGRCTDSLNAQRSEMRYATVWSSTWNSFKSSAPQHILMRHRLLRQVLLHWFY
jgi:hypothetical protein